MPSCRVGGVLVCILGAASALWLSSLPSFYLAREAIAEERTGEQALRDSRAVSASPRAVLRGNDGIGQNDEHVGDVTWRVEPADAVGAQIEDVRADVEIPERKFKMTMLFRRNTDALLPAAKLMVEMTFQIAPDLGEHVGSIAGMLVKSDERARPTPLSGLAAKRDDDDFFFRVADIAGLNDPLRNILLIRQRPWFEVPLVYTDQHRVIVAIEKGESGQRAFDKVFAAWGL